MLIVLAGCENKACLFKEINSIQWIRQNWTTVVTPSTSKLKPH